MTRASLREYAAVQRPRDQHATRAEKRQRLNEVVTVTGKDIMGTDRHLDIQVTGRTTSGTDFSLGIEMDAVAVSHSGGNPG